MHYIVLFLFVFIAGVVPVFGPPSWVFAVYFQQHFALSPVLVVLLAAIATTVGRLLLAVMTRRLKPHISKKYVSNLDYSQQLLLKKRKSLWTVIGLFVLSPLPSAQLFEAAGLIDIPLLPLGLAFFIGRLISLSLYLGLAHLAINNFDSLWEAGFTSIWAVILEVLAIFGLIALLNLRSIVGRFAKRKKINSFK